MRRALPASGRLGGVVFLVLATACNGDKTVAPTVDLIACPFSSPGGDLIERGFYVESFPGVSLREVHLWFSSNVAGTYQIRLTAQRDVYGGPLIGSATASVAISANVMDSAQATFDFGGRNVPSGNIVAFSMQTESSAGGRVYYAVNTSNTSCPVTETDGTLPPLDAFRRAGIAVRITGSTS